MSAHERGPGGLLAGLEEIADSLSALERSLAEAHQHLDLLRERLPELARDLTEGAGEALSREQLAVAEARLAEAGGRAESASARAAALAEATKTAVRPLLRRSSPPSAAPAPRPISGRATPASPPALRRPSTPELRGTARTAADEPTARTAMPAADEDQEESVETGLDHRRLRTLPATPRPPARTSPTGVPSARPAPPERMPLTVPGVVQRVSEGLRTGALETPMACRVAERDLDAVANTLEGEASALAGYLLARVRARLDDQQGAYAALKQAWDRSERHGIVALGLGEHYLRAGSPREALGYLDRALRADVRDLRSHGEILVLASEAAARCGKSDLAEAMMVEASQEDDPPPIVLRALARRALQAEDRVGAADYLSQLIERAVPAEQLQAVGELADLLVSLDRPEEAIERLDAVLAAIAGSDPVVDQLERQLLSLQMQQQQYARAAVAAERRVARGFTATRAEAHRFAAHAYRALGEHGREVDHLKQARKIDSASTELALEYARARDAAGQHHGLEREITDMFLLPALGSKTRAELLRILGVCRMTSGDSVGAEKAWREGASLGDVGAAGHYAARLALDPARQVEAIAALKSLLVLDPARIDAIRMLAELYRSIEAIPEATVCSGILHLVDPNAPPGEPPPAEAVRAPPPDMLQDLCPLELRAAAAAAALIWEHGAPLLRTDLNAIGVSPAQRLSPLEDLPVAAVYASSIRLLGVPKTAMFLRPHGDGLQVAATLPPSVICGRDAAIGVPEVRFRLARAVASTRPEYLIWAALPIDRAKAAYEGIRFAFGPSDPLSQVSEATALGHEYVRLLPPKVQRQLRELLATTPLPPFAETRRLVDLALHRAALVATGDPAAALRVAAEDTPELSGIDVSTPAGFERAVRGSEVARDIVRFALSDAYLTLRFRLEETRS